MKKFSPVPLKLLLTDASKESTAAGTLSLSKENWHTCFSEYANYLEQSGIYVFWWKENEDYPLPQDTKHWVKGKRKSADKDPDLTNYSADYFHGKKAGTNEDTVAEYIHYLGEWTFEPVLISGENYFPLYVGKSTNVIERIIQHLRWPTTYAEKYADRLADHERGEGDEKYYLVPRYNTASQFSDHFHFLFRDDMKNVQSLKINQIYLSVEFVDFEDYAKRFFEEDLLIGKLRPPFNLDSER